MKKRNNTYLGSLCKRGHNFEDTGKNLRYKCNGACVECLKEHELSESQKKYQREYQKKYRLSEDGKESARKYAQSEKRKEAQKKYQQSEICKERVKKYHQTEKHKKYVQSDKYKKYQRVTPVLIPTLTSIRRFWKEVRSRFRLN